MRTAVALPGIGAIRSRVLTCWALFACYGGKFGSIGAEVDFLLGGRATAGQFGGVVSGSSTTREAFSSGPTGRIVGSTFNALELEVKSGVFADSVPVWALAFLYNLGG